MTALLFQKPYVVDDTVLLKLLTRMVDRTIKALLESKREWDDLVAAERAGRRKAA